MRGPGPAAGAPVAVGMLYPRGFPRCVQYSMSISRPDRGSPPLTDDTIVASFWSAMSIRPQSKERQEFTRKRA